MIRQRRRGILGTTIAVCVPSMGLGLLADTVLNHEPGKRICVNASLPVSAADVLREGRPIGA